MIAMASDPRAEQTIWTWKAEIRITTLGLKTLDMPGHWLLDAAGIHLGGAGWGVCDAASGCGQDLKHRQPI